MLKWLMKGQDANYQDIFMNVTEGLQSSYKEKMLPVEKLTNFNSCYAPPLTD